VAWPGEPLEERVALGFVVAAARELFEEAGVLLARGAARQAVVERLRAGEAFVDALLDLRLDVEGLVPWAHWVTPSVEQKRYDTRFFVTRLPAGEDAVLDERESTELVWLRPADALAGAARGEVVLPPPTVRHLEDMLPHAEPGALLDFARQRLIAPIQPKISDAPAIVLPWDADYDATPGEPGRPGPHPMAQGPSRLVLEDGRWVSR
jgi:8-oxo-dGTP pyrophosphatase MutT (NUDIX family)